MYSVLLSAHSQQRLYARAAAKAILQQIQGEDGDIRSDVAAPPGASRARVLGLCGDLANLEAFCLVIDICVEVDRMGGAGRVDVQDILASKFLQVKWALRSPPHSRADGRGVEVVRLIPSSAQAVSHISSALIRQLTTEQAKLYDEALAHTASYLQRLIQFVQSGKGSSGSVLTDNATSNELRSLVARVSAVRDSIEVSTESYVNNAAGITNWADPKPPKVAGGHGKHATSGKHGSVVAFADSVGELQHHTPHTKQHPRSALPTSADSAPTFNAALELESEYEQAQFSVYSAQAAQQQEHLRIQLSEQLSSKKGSKVRFGLPNLGNSCYLSCIVQCLAHITPLAAYLVGGEYQPVYTTSDASLTFPPSDEHCITHRLAALLSVVSGPAGASATPTLEREWLAFTRSVRLLNHRSFDNASQQDAEEFLGWLLTRIEAELKLGRQETPLVQRMFSFARRCNWTCEKCGRHSTGPTEADSRLMVQRNPAAGQGSSTLKDWLEYTTRWETGCSHNCHDPACGGTTATMRYSIEQSSLPAILTIALQRSQSVDDKDETAVDFPVQGLDMQPYCDGLGGTAVYDLFAFCNHVGGPSLRSGHYLAYARDSKGMSETWSEFDDAKVTSVRSIDDLLSAEHTQNDNNTHAENYYSGTNYTNRDARRDVYILFYKKRTA
jgi:ubiquitin C-terminal hydrolase